MVWTVNDTHTHTHTHTRYHSPVGKKVESVLLDDAVLHQVCRAHGLERGGPRVTLRPLLADHHHHTPLWDGAVHKHILPGFWEDVGEPEEKERERMKSLWCI